jgi:hypothetical protein
LQNRTVPLTIGKPVVRLYGDHRAARLDVTYDHVEDLAALADWLRATHAGKQPTLSQLTNNRTPPLGKRPG